MRASVMAMAAVVAVALVAAGGVFGDEWSVAGSAQAWDTCKPFVRGYFCFSCPDLGTDLDDCRLDGLD